MANIDHVTEKATALGCTLERGPYKGSGYLLTDGTGEYQLGAGYTASLADVERYLDAALSDAGVDEVESGCEEIKAPTDAELKRALVDHPNAAEIAKILDPPAPTAADLRRQRQNDLIVIGTLGMRSNYFRLTESDRAAWDERARAITDGEKQKEALEREKIRRTGRGVGVDHPLFEEKVRQSQVFRKADLAIFRTNLQSRHDEHPDQESRPCEEYGLPPDGADDEDTLPPEAEAPDYRVVNAATNVTVTAIRRKVPKADRGTARARMQIEQITSAVRAALGMRKPAIGALLRQAREILGAAGYAKWLSDVGIPESSARRWAKEVTV